MKLLETSRTSRIPSAATTAVIGLLLFLTGTSFAGILVAPTVVFISDLNRTGRLEVQNTSNEPREVTIRLAYGLPQSDSVGNVFVQLQDSNITDPRSAVDWVKPFPRKVLVPPNGTQVIRLVARPPQGLADGEYWARIVVTSREGASQLPAIQGEEQIATRLNMVMQTAIMLKYRTGDCATRIEIGESRAALTEAGAEIMLGLENKGNASYMGVLHCKVSDADGKAVAQREFNIAVYDRLTRRVDLEFDRSLFRAPFTANLKVTSEGRTDVAREDMLAGNEVSYSMTFE